MHLAILVNSLPPYRINQHLRLATEIPNLTLSTLMSHDTGSSRWPGEKPSSIRQISFISADGLPQSFIHEWKRGRLICQWIEENHPDLVIVNGYNDAGRYRVIKHCSKMKVPCCVWGDANKRSDKASGLKLLLKRIYLKNIFRKADVALVNGSEGENFFSYYGVSADRILRLPLQPNWSLLADIGKYDILTAKSLASLDPYKRYLVYGGRFEKVKRIDLLIDAFTAVAHKIPGWDLLLIGKGSQLTNYKARIVPSLKNRVHWQDFVESDADLFKLYKACDVFVLPSESEQWGLVIQEAAALGLAIIASDRVGAAVDLVKDNVNGCIHKSGDIDSVQSAILKCCTNERVLARMQGSSLEIIKKWRAKNDTIVCFERILSYFGLAGVAENVQVDRPSQL